MSVGDDGPGILIERISREPPPVRPVMFSRQNTGRHYSVVNALSTWLEVETSREGARWMQAYRRGMPTSELHAIGEATAPGTVIRFEPDPEIFGDSAFDLAAIGQRLQELAWLHEGLRVVYQGEPLTTPGGLAGWASELAEAPLEMCLHVCDTAHEVDVEVVFAWRGEGDRIVRAFVNGESVERGTHVVGLWTGLARLATDMLGSEIGVDRTTERLGDGLVTLARIGVPVPRWTGWRREEITNPEVAVAVQQLLATAKLDEAQRRFLIARLM